MPRRRRKFIVPKKAIISIHNYCDRWCERCEFTSRCSVFAMGQAEDRLRDAKSRDPENREFWEELGATFVDVRQMLREKCIKMGIDPDKPLTDEEEAEERRRDDAVARNNLVRASKAYFEKTMKWFRKSEPLFKAKEVELIQRARLELPNSPDPHSEAIELKDLLEVVQWYHTMIPAKVHRAVYGAVRGVPKIIEDLPKDSDGSAKIALISVDRSIAAWARLRTHFTEQKDAILDTLVELDRLRRGIEQAFPAARAFVRPGFDEPRDAGKRKRRKVRRKRRPASE